MPYTSSQVIAGHVFIDKAWFPPQMANSSARALVASTGAAVCLIKKNGVQIATMTFAGGNPIPVFANMAAAVTFAVGDYMTVEAPVVLDDTLDDILLSLWSERYL